MACSALLRRRCVSGILRSGRMLSTASGGMKSPLLMVRPDCDVNGEAIFRMWCCATNDVHMFFDNSYNKKKQSFGLNYMNHQFIVDGTYRTVGSSQGWVAYQDHCNLFLIDPTTYRATYLPNLEIHTEVHSLVLSDDEKQPKAFVISGSDNTLAFCLPSHTHEWAPLSDRVYESVVYSSIHRHLFCATASPLKLECWDVTGSPTLAHVTELDSHCHHRRGDKFDDIGIVMYIVCEEQSGELFLVVRHVSYVGVTRHETMYGDFLSKDPTVGFVVYRVDRERQRLVKIERSLEGLTMFVGNNDPVAIRDVDGVQPDAIYLTYDNRIGYNTDIDIYDYKKDDFFPLSPDDPAEQPVWFTPKI